jgi:crotonobetainyl-CoA:carnitine CoA-transferase CaiB-like acyl-CoA transferase
MAPQSFECRDGWVALIVATEGDWTKFCQAIERPDLVGYEGATLAPNGLKICRTGGGNDKMFRQQTKRSVGKLPAVGLPIGPVQNAKEIFECPMSKLASC